MNLEKIISWTNDNSGFLSVILFFATIFCGWLSGFFSSIIKKPKLKVKFIDKLLFFNILNTGEKHLDNDIEYDIHKSSFIVYMSIANIGNMNTSIDKIYLGYEKDNYYIFKKKIWLHQWHTLEPVNVPIADNKFIAINPLLGRSNEMDFSDRTSLEAGRAILGFAYFEQASAWGNYKPFINKDGAATIYIKIIDIYGNKFNFKINMKQKDIEEAKKVYKYFGSTSELIYS